jgi:zinc transporter 9
MGLYNYIQSGADPAAVAVMMEDGAAVAGLVIAGTCMAICVATGNHMWDAAGSVGVSLLLGAVAVVLIQRNRDWLIGRVSGDTLHARCFCLGDGSEGRRRRRGGGGDVLPWWEQ